MFTEDKETNIKVFSYDESSITPQDYKDACEVLRISFDKYKDIKKNIDRKAFAKIAFNALVRGSHTDTSQTNQARASLLITSLMTAKKLLCEINDPLNEYIDSYDSFLDGGDLNDPLSGMSLSHPELFKSKPETQHTRTYNNYNKDNTSRFYNEYISQHEELKNAISMDRYQNICHSLPDLLLARLERNIRECSSFKGATSLFPRVPKQFKFAISLDSYKRFLTWTDGVNKAMTWIKDQVEIHGDNLIELYCPTLTEGVMLNKDSIKTDLAEFKGIRQSLTWLNYNDLKPIKIKKHTFETHFIGLETIKDFQYFLPIDLFQEYSERNTFKEHFFTREFYDLVCEEGTNEVKSVINRYKELEREIKAELPLHKFWSIVKSHDAKDQSARADSSLNEDLLYQSLAPFKAALAFLEIYQTLYPSSKKQLNFEECIKTMDLNDVCYMSEDGFFEYEKVGFKLKRNKSLKDKKSRAQLADGSYNLIKKAKAKQRRANAKQYGIYGALTLLTLTGVGVFAPGLMALPFVNVTIAVGLVAQLAATLSLSTTVMAAITSGIGALIATIGAGSLTGKLIADHRDKAHRENSPLYYDVKHIKSSFNRATGRLGSDLDVKQQRAKKQQGQPSYNSHSKGKPHLFPNTQRVANNIVKNLGRIVKRAPNI